MNEIPDLEQVCPMCAGERWHQPECYDSRIRCRTCNGKGVVLTSSGEKVLEFLRKHIVVH